ncbi:MAG: nucleotidyltransferase family protein [bacterium]
MKAVVLCAGYGKRLKGLTRKLPKPMLPLEEYPLLYYTVNYLKKYGIVDIFINLHYKPEIIKDYFGNGSAFGVKLKYSYEENVLGTAGALLKMKSWLKNEDDFLVLYGDILTNQNLKTLIDFHRKKKAFATLLVHQRKSSNSIIELGPQRRITKFIERPTKKQIIQFIRGGSEYHWVNSGIQVLSRQILSFIPKNKEYDLPRDLYTSLISEERFYGIPLSGFRVAMDSPQRYKEAQKAVRLGIFKI